VRVLLAAGSLLLAWLLSGCSSATSSAPLFTPTLAVSPTPDWNLTGWDLVWHDEFDGTSLDPSKWEIEVNARGGGGWPGYPDATSVFPQTLLVDYVRVYQKPK